ncbi:MAG: hypothetical protein H0T53_01680 [Herpetosiphonaceae bacterium]|nr:hypothetical protein [Herpetosiphonaceae bacterium]
MSKSDPSVNPNAKPEQEQPDPNKDTAIHKHRSVESQVEGGQNQYEGEPHEGYGEGGHNQGRSARNG